MELRFEERTKLSLLQLLVKTSDDDLMSDFMDKRIMGLSRSFSDDFSELSYPQGRDEGGGDDLHSYELSRDDFDSSFRFHPVRHTLPFFTVCFIFGLDFLEFRAKFYTFCSIKIHACCF